MKSYVGFLVERERELRLRSIAKLRGTTVSSLLRDAVDLLLGASLNDQTLSINRPLQVDPDDIIRSHEAAATIGVGLRTLYKWSEAGFGPTPIKVGYARCYLRSEVERWAEIANDVRKKGRKHIKPDATSRKDASTAASE